MIKIEHLSKTYKRLVLNDISVTFPERQVGVIVGINGSGKTTFLDCVVGLKRPSEGEIWIDSHHNQSDPFKEQVFYIPSDFYLPDYMTGNEYIQFVLARYPNADLDKVDSFFELYDLKEAKNQLLESYSFGMKKKVQIIAAVLSNAPYVLGDEVFNGLDFETTLITVKLFQALLDHRSFVLISHNMTIINHFCDHIFLMSNGKLVPFTGDASQLEAEVLRMESVHDKITFIQRYATFDDNVSE